MDSVKNQVDAILTKLCFLDDINPDQKLRDDLDIDSLKLTELVITLEEHFEIELDMDDLNPENLESVYDLYLLIEKYAK